MWKRRVKLTAIAVVATVAAVAFLIALLWRDRPDLDSIDWPEGPEAVDGGLSAT